ncbi:hypothetical protein [Streptomyces sp. NPDC058657]|uniref:hypothetical protein n=1 Tax=unclassified Streptomyces TaxID=2593676 RepID=UPI003648F54F
MHALIQTTLFTLPEPPAQTAAPVTAGKPRTVLSYGLGADSTAIILKFLADPVAHGLEPDLSDLIVVHAVTGDEWPDSLSYVDRLVLPLLAARKVRTVQIARGGRRDADGVVILDDTRAPKHVRPVGPWRLSSELRAAGTVPQMASGRRTCSIRFKGWCLDAWAAHEFGTDTFRRVIGYHAGEQGRADKDSAIQQKHNQDAGRAICEPYYPLIEAGMNRASVEAYVLARLGEKIRKSYCAQCPFSGVCASRERHEERLREHPEIGSAVLMMEYTSQALNEKVALYGERSLYQQLAEDVPANDAVLSRFERDLDRTPFALYEVRRLYLPGRTKDCRTWHGKRCSSPQWWCRTKRTAKCRRGHRAGFELRSGWLDTAPWCEGHNEMCRGEQAKGQAWRSVRVTFEGTRLETEMAVLRWGREAQGVRVRSGRNSLIKRAHYLDAGDGYPSADAYLVAAPAGVESKQRGGFEEKWTQVTGLVGTRLPARALPVAQRQRRLNGYVPVHHMHKEQCASGVGLTA